MARPRKIKQAFDARRAKDRRFSSFCRRHPKEVSAQLGSGRIDWKTAIDVFTEFHLTDAHGQPITADTAARTWRRVRAEMAVKEARRAAAVPVLPSLFPGEIAPGVRLSRSPSVPGLSLEAPAARPVASASAVAATSPSPAPAALGAPDGPAADGATEQIRRALARLGHDRVPMPKRP